MGYTTDLEGRFSITPPLRREHVTYLKAFNRTRRMRRIASKAEALPDPIRVAAGLPIGIDGGFFVGGIGFMGQEPDASVVDRNASPSDQPGLWCQWVPSDDGAALMWDEGEKFYDYVEWLRYLVTNFLTPWGHTLNGTVKWQGESADDFGEIVVRDSHVQTRTGRRTLGELEG